MSNPRCVLEVEQKEFINELAMKCEKGEVKGVSKVFFI